MELINKLSKQSNNLRNQVKEYRKWADAVKSYLFNNPNEWGRFQSQFNYEINGVFRFIMDYETDSLNVDKVRTLNKLKKMFVRKIRRYFLHGEYIVRSLRKPFGYAGDYKIIDDIYTNKPATMGFERLFDNYFQMSSISVAVRNRKEDFKGYLVNLISRKDLGADIHIMNLGCGPCRDLLELFQRTPRLQLENRRVTIDCYDNEARALDYARSLIEKEKPAAVTVNYMKENILKMAIGRNLDLYKKKKYDFIYSMGLFDYFNDRLSMRLLRNLKSLLKSQGVIAVSSVREKSANPSVHFMEWVGDWNLCYRNDRSFYDDFLDAGFRDKDLRVGYEQQGILQYILGTNSGK